MMRRGKRRNFAMICTLFLAAALVLPCGAAFALPCSAADAAGADGTAGADEGSAADAPAAEQTKVELKKQAGGKYRCYENGKLVKNRWMTINGGRYYFGKNGNAYTGIQAIKGKFYAFGTKGKQNVKKTAKLQKAAKYEKDISSLKKLIGKPLKKKYYKNGCYRYKGQSGRDGEWKYKDFTVGTFRTNSGKEIFMWVEGKK